MIWRLNKQFQEFLSGARRRAARGFTLIELLVVIAVAGILATLAVPAIKEFGKSNAQVAATRQMLDATGRARQLAIANRTTVYMAFLPNGILTEANFGSLSKEAQDRARNLAPLQGRAYALISLRKIGDQPGGSQPQYLTEWTSLPRGWIFDPTKFLAGTNYIVPGNTIAPHDPDDEVLVSGFVWSGEGTATNALPFPSASAPTGLFELPYIAFNYNGSLASARDYGGEIIPLARGVVDPATDEQGRFLLQAASIQETPPGNSQDVPNLIFVDGLVGRARLEERKIE